MLTRRRSRTDSTLSATGQDSTETLKNNCTAFFVLLRCFDADIQPAPTNRNPIAPTASAANASGSVQTTLSKLPRPPDLHIPAFCFGAVPIGTYRLSGLIYQVQGKLGVKAPPHREDNQSASRGAGSGFCLCPSKHLSRSGRRSFLRLR